MFNWFKNPSLDINSFQGEAIVSVAIRPHRKGQVYFQGVWWCAKCRQPITLEIEEVVEVVGREDDSITLLVKPIAWQ